MHRLIVALSAAGALALVHHPLSAATHHRRRGRGAALAADADAAAESSAGAADQNATVYSKTRQFSEERYPYEVYDTAPPSEMVGVFPLSPTTGCGDILRLTRAGDADATEAAYLIKKVSASYRWRDGSFHLLSKRADATEVNRHALEKRLSRLMPREQ